MYDVIFHIIVGIVGMMLGIKNGFEYLARDLNEQMRLKPEEYKYITSWEYFWKSFRIFNND